MKRPEHWNQPDCYRTRASRRDSRSRNLNVSGRTFRTRFTVLGIKERLGEQTKPPTPMLPHAAGPVSSVPIIQSMIEILPTKAGSSEEENPPINPVMRRANTRSTRQIPWLSRKSLAVIDSPNMAIANFLSHRHPRNTENGARDIRAPLPQSEASRIPPAALDRAT